MASTSRTIRRWLLTGSVAAITAYGAYLGAWFKAREEYKQERRATIEISPSERIAQLENLKANLLAQRGVLQSKIDQLATKSDGTTQEVLKPPR